jgi:hypothetical protein
VRGVFGALDASRQPRPGRLSLGQANNASTIAFVASDTDTVDGFVLANGA